MSFETQHRIVTAQAAHQLLQALHCPSHGDFLPIGFPVFYREIKQAPRLLKTASNRCRRRPTVEYR